MKIVINERYGGFSLSEAALQWLIDHKQWKVTTYNEEGNLTDEDAPIVDKTNSHLEFLSQLTKSKYSLMESDLIRSHQDLIEVVETLGSKEASGWAAELKIVEIPDGVDWTIQEYDGNEWIAEKHRTWS